MSSFGWVDLNQILDLFKENNKLNWLTYNDINKMLIEQEIQWQSWDRSSECRDLLRMLKSREPVKIKVD